MKSKYNLFANLVSQVEEESVLQGGHWSYREQEIPN